MQQKDLTITGYSTALFSTWFFIEELGLLFDCGDGVMAGLLQKSRKVKNVFISHPDRDHLSGLIQFNQLNARSGFPTIHFPADSGSFQYIADFTKRFDPHVSGTIWKPIQPPVDYSIKSDVLIRPIRNNHIPAEDGITKSLSFKVIQTKKKLKPKFSTFSPNQIKEIALKKGKEYISNTIETNILSYSGDTPVEDWNRWDHSKILIHEATFLGEENVPESSKNKHSTLEEVFEMVANISIEQLILSHFSTRYSKEQIKLAIKKLCEKYQIKIPVFAVFPGKIHQNILKETPINK